MSEEPKISENYPYGMSNKEIEQDIQSYCRAINNNAGRPEISAGYSPLIQLGQAELQLRLARKTFWISILIGGLSLIISCVALGLAYSANHSSDDWEVRQIELLESMNSKLDRLISTTQSNDSPNEKPANKLLKSDS